MNQTLMSDMGVGVGLRPPYYNRFLEQPPASVNWIEVISENFMVWRHEGTGDGLRKLLKLRRDRPVALHGVSLNLGSADPIDQEYVEALKRVIDNVEPFVVSDHLAWTGVNGQNLHDLLPLPYTRETLRHIAGKIERVQNALGRRILIENPSSYLEFTGSEMSEWEFLNELLSLADCGLLLDVNNIYVSSVNHGFDSMTYLESLPSGRIGQIHLAGHSRLDGYLIDTHDMPICDEVWELYIAAIERFGPVSTMVERDDNIPEWDELEGELLRIHELRRTGRAGQ